MHGADGCSTAPAFQRVYGGAEFAILSVRLVGTSKNALKLKNGARNFGIFGRGITYKKYPGGVSFRISPGMWNGKPGGVPLSADECPRSPGARMIGWAQGVA
eukprot:gene15986-biopygen23239